MNFGKALLLALLALAGSACEQEPPAAATDDPESLRVVTLAPHLAELMFAIDAGDLLVGVSAWSDYPQEVRNLPVIGDAFAIDHEQLALLAPDLLLVWESGTPAHTVAELRASGFQVQVVRTRSLADVSQAMLALGVVVGRADSAQQAAAQFESALQQLAQQHSGADSVSVFYQVSAQPLYTISGEHFLSDLIRLCGGRNVFSDLGELAPAISDEAVLARDPEVMLSGARDGDPFAIWQRWPALAANRFGNHFRVDPDTSTRPTPRLLSAARDICAALQRAREQKAAH